MIRPLLGVMPARLRATLRRAGVGWVEDPSNTDKASARGALRAGSIDVEGELAQVKRAGAARSWEEAMMARELGRCVSLHPTGHAQVRGVLSLPAWSALLWTVSGQMYPPSPAAVARLVRADGGTLHGVVLRNGRLMREPAAVGSVVVAEAGAIWDGRFVLRERVASGVMDGIGPSARALRHRLRRGRMLPSPVIDTLPVVCVGAELLMSMQLDYLADGSWPSVQVDYRPVRPLAGAPFLPG